MKYPRYPEYKDSGITWLGNVPKHWEVKRIKNFVQLLTQKSDQRVNPIALENIESWSGKKIITETEYEGDGVSFNAGDILFGKLRPYLAKVLLASEPGEAVGDFHVIRPSAKLHGHFLQYQFLNSSFISIIDSSTFGAKMPRASWEFMGGISLSFPSFEEQQSIATFLDRETAKIDALIAEQEKLVALLAEKRQAVISHAVTKGLDPTAPMKDSGIAWLGQVPKHWDVERIKFVISSIEQGWSPLCEGYPVETDDEWGVLKVGCVNTGAFNPKENKKLPDDLTPIPELSIKKDDLLISRANTRELVGSAATAETDYPNLLLCDKLYRLRMKDNKCLPLFMSYYLRSNIARGQIELSATGASSSMQNIGQASITELPIALPDIDEQSKIISRIIKNTANIDTLTTQAKRAIELLKEHRSALISACVTGQIDVRGCVEPSKDVTEAA